MHSLTRYLMNYRNCTCDCNSTLVLVFRAKNSAELLARFRPSGKTLTAAALLFCAALLCMTRESVFIYFNF